MNEPLDAYKAKRDFSKTPEPSGDRRKGAGGNSYVIQKHAARRLHYDFRLELNGVLKSWAVPEGPSLVPGEKRLAVHVEDHPLEYGGFEGVIPKGEYGGGTVMIWDRGTWTPEFDPDLGYGKGHLRFRLEGEKLKGEWHLVRMARRPREKHESWLLFKSDDEAARGADAADILEEMPLSAASGRDMEAIARDQDRVWSSKQGELAEPAPGGPRSAPSVDFAKIGGAKADKLPSFVEPSLPSTVEKAPSGGGWIHEIKYDGYRIQIRLENGRAALLTRQGIDWTERFPSVAKAALALPLKSALIDSEVVVESEAGVASHVALVEALKSGARSGFVVHAFDLLHADGFDLRAAPLIERKAALAKVLEAQDTDSCIRFSDHIDGDGDVILRHVCRLGLEGVVSKKASSPYRSGRVKTWLKIRCVARGDFVIAGYVPSSVAKNAVGALVLGEHVGGKLVAAGHVGTGFGDAGAKELWQRLDPFATKTPAFKDETAEGKKARWVEPRLVADVEYRGRTSANLIWHASYKGLIEGKRPSEVVRPDVIVLSERPKPAPSVRLTNPARLLWPEEGVTKQGLVDFYTGIADWILPHIAGRPLSLLRCPGGVHEQCFFQKHRWAGLGQAVRLVPIPGDDEPMVAIDDLAGLLELVQAGVLEIHPWGSRTETPELPDRITIDLDPGEDVPWEQVIAGAFDVRARLSDMGLQSFVKTTGGKGLHVVLPISSGPSWEAVKAFALSLSERMAAESPDRYTDNMAKRVRHGRIYVDYLRNGMGATAVAAYSTRARPGAAVSTPLAWDELGQNIRANHFTVENLPTRLAFLDEDPWEEMLTLQQELPAPLKVGKPKRRSSKAAATEPPSAPEESIPGAAAPPKSELAAYWTKVGKAALKHLGQRPLRLVRNVGGKPAYHYGLLPPLPAAVHTLEIEKQSGGEGSRPWVDSVEGLLGLVEIDVIELHPWGATIDDIEHPDMLVFNLDSDEGMEWSLVTESALQLRELLRSEGLDSWPKLTGGKSVHVMVPVEPDLNWAEAHDYCREIAERLAATAPQRYSTTASKAKRAGRVLIDWQRNARGNTALGAYSPRALAGFPVAAPVTWKQLEAGFRTDAFTLEKPPPASRR